jgi:hypothetical protein
VRTTAKVFAASGAFGVGVAALYWFLSYEWAGTVLLALMGVAAWIVAAYAWLELRRSRPRPPADDAEAEPGAAAGEVVDAFTADSPWPIVLAVGVAVVAGGLVFGVPLLVVGTGVCLLAAIGLMRESVG